jgi:hypothetical protein
MDTDTYPEVGTLIEGKSWKAIALIGADLPEGATIVEMDHVVSERYGAAISMGIFTVGLEILKAFENTVQMGSEYIQIAYFRDLVFINQSEESLEIQIRNKSGDTRVFSTNKRYIVPGTWLDTLIEVQDVAREINAKKLMANVERRRKELRQILTVID